MRQLRTALVTALVCGTGLARADADALTDMLGPREIAVGEAMRGGATGSTAVSENPSGAGLNHELVFDGSFGYRAADNSELIGVSACDSTNAAPGCFFYDHIGQNPDLDGMSTSSSTHIAGLSLSHQFSEHILVGSTIKYFHFSTDLPDVASTSGINWDLGATIRFSQAINIGVAGYNLWGTESVEFPRGVGGGVMMHPLPTIGLSFDSVWKTAGGGARYGGGAEWFIGTSGGQYGFPIRAGVLRDNDLGSTYLSGGLGLASMTYGFDITGRFKVDGGSETMLIASLRVYGPRVASQ